MSTLLQNQLQRAASRPAYQIAKQFGELIQYSSRGATAFGVYAMPVSGGVGTMRMTIGMRAMETEVVFEIPYPPDASFPPADGITIDDQITDSDGNIYAVRRFESDSLNSMYDVTAVTTMAKQIGAVGQ